MGFSQENGYIPVDVQTIIDQIMVGINAQYSKSFTRETFTGTSFYKNVYALAQKVQQGEIVTSEVFEKLRQYITLTNEKIQRPSVSAPGLLDSFASKGYVISVKPPAEADAGKVYICVDVDESADDYADTKLEIAELIRDFVTAETVTMGDQVESIALTNGQSFDFKFSLPNRIPVLLRLTLDVSENNQMTIPGDEAIRQVVFDRINERYGLGKNFEPQRYYNLADAPWAASSLLEWSDDAGSTWHDEVYDAAFDDLFTFGLEDIAVTVND